MEPQLRIDYSPIHGLGCYAAAPISSGVRVREYIGERIPAAEAIRREADTTRPAIFTLWLDEERAIDGWVGGNESIYINHCCEPNCDWDFEEDRAFIITVRDIALDEELTIDYAYDANGPKERCGCGATACRGTLNVPAE